MAAIQDFILRIKVDGQEKIKSVNDQVKGLGTQILVANQKLGDLITNLPNAVKNMGAFGIAVSAAGTAISALVVRGVKLGDELGDLADATDISAGSLLTFRNSIIEAGGKAEDFAQIASKLNQSVQEAAGGNEQLQKAFKSLGVFVTDANGELRPTGDILKDLTAKFREGRLSGEEFNSAVDILGKTVNKLDLTKLRATEDFAAQEQITQITKMTAEIDKLVERFNRLALSIAGAIAASINRRLEEQDAALEQERQNNLQGRTRFAPEGSSFGDRYGDPYQMLPMGGTRAMTPEEILAFERQDRPRKQFELEGGLLEQQRFIQQYQRGGGFGAQSEAQLKALAEFRKRLEESTTAAATAIFLQGQEDRLQIARTTGNELQRIEAQLAFDEARIRNDAADQISSERRKIFSQDRLTEDEMMQEFAQKSVEIERKRDLEIARTRNKTILDMDKFRRDQMIRAFNEEEAQRQQTREELAAEEDLRRDALRTTYANIEALREANNETEQRNRFELEIVNLTEKEQRFRRAAFELDLRRQKALRDLANTANLTADDRAEAEQRVNKEFERSLDLLAEQEGRLRQVANSFSDGWAQAMDKYVEASKNGSSQAQTLFTTATRGMEDAFVNFAQTGKLSFKDMANAIIADLVRIAVQKGIAGFMSGGFNFFGGGSEMAGAAVLGLPGFASGGYLPSGQTGIVGENGPELITGPANIEPMNSRPQVTNINYSISAVDAQSFKQLVARDPQFIYNVTEAGRRSTPSRRLS